MVELCDITETEIENTLVSEVRKHIKDDFSTTLRHRSQYIKALLPESFNENYDFVWFDTSKSSFIWQPYVFRINILKKRFSLRQPFNVKGFLFFDVCGIESSIEINFDFIFEMKGMGWSTNADTHLPSSWTIFQRDFRLFKKEEENELIKFGFYHNYFQQNRDEKKGLKNFI